MKKIFRETITFGMGHSLIMAHKPEKVSMDQIHHKMETDNHDIEKFGLFERATPNYTTYYPDVTTEDLQPSESDFIEPVFRMLSNVTVHSGWNPIYFPVEVLKASMSMLVGQTINVDHEMAVGNAVGSVKAVEWQNAYTTNGVKVPAGINGVMKIDGKANPRLARGIMMDPPSIHSNSVTVNFSWEKSHPKMSDEDFFSKLGTKDDKGKLVQKVATRIEAYHETSLVSHGADPFAQKVGSNGRIVNPGYAGSRYNLSDQTIESNSNNSNYVYVDFKQFSADHLESENQTISNKENMEEFLSFLETLHGLEAGTLTEENYQAKLTEINQSHVQALIDAALPEPVVVLDLTGVEAIETEITSLRTRLAAVPENLVEKINLAETGQIVITELRADTTRLYNLVAEGKVDAAILATIAGADYKTLKAFHKQYSTLADDQFKFTCDECGSEHVTRTSASAATTEKTEVSDEEILNKFVSGVEVVFPRLLKPNS